MFAIDLGQVNIDGAQLAERVGNNILILAKMATFRNIYVSSVKSTGLGTTIGGSLQSTNKTLILRLQ